MKDLAKLTQEREEKEAQKMMADCVKIAQEIIENLGERTVEEALIISRVIEDLLQSKGNKYLHKKKLGEL